MTSNELIDALERIGREPRSYSGRGMYGRECVGVELKDVREVFCLGVDLASDATEDERFGLSNLRTAWDSLGLDVILYFPDMGWPKDRKDSGDVEE